MNRLRQKAAGFVLLELLLELGLWLTGLVLVSPLLFQLEGLARRSRLDLAVQTAADTLSALQQRNLFLTGHHLAFRVGDEGKRGYAWRDVYCRNVLDLPRLGLDDFVLEGRGGQFTSNGGVEKPFTLHVTDSRDLAQRRTIHFQPVQGRMVYE